MLAFRRPEPLRAPAKIEPNEILAEIYQDSLSGRETLLNGQMVRAASNSARINEAGDSRGGYSGKILLKYTPSPLHPLFLVSCRAAFASKIALRGKGTMNGVPFHGYVG